MLNQTSDALNSKEMSFQPNTIYNGDCRDVLRRFPEGCVDLIYLDPPFFSNKNYEVIWNDGYELRAFEDRWKGGIENYIAWMAERLSECHRVLKETGSIFLHCDWRATSRLRITLDDIFGDDNFRNEIMWFYTGASSPGQQQLPRKHETIWWYSKDDNWRFNDDEVRTPYSDATMSRIKAGMKGGKSSQSIFHGIRTKRDVNKKGKIIEDWWSIPTLGSTAKERLGYPTQKPEALLDRIIRMSSIPTDIILDPFCGCGTTIAVAHKLGRRWIGIDVSPTACKLMQKRLKSNRAVNVKVIGLPATVDDLKKLQPFEFQNWVMEKLWGRMNPRKTGDFGIDGYYLDGTPIQVKQSDDVGRNVIDNFETAIQRKNRKNGVIVAFSFGRGAHEEVARAKNTLGVEIILKTVQEILDET